MPSEDILPAEVGRLGNMISDLPRLQMPRTVRVHDGSPPPKVPALGGSDRDLVSDRVLLLPEILPAPFFEYLIRSIHHKNREKQSKESEKRDPIHHILFSSVSLILSNRNSPPTTIHFHCAKHASDKPNRELSLLSLSQLIKMY